MTLLRTLCATLAIALAAPLAGVAQTSTGSTTAPAAGGLSMGQTTAAVSKPTLPSKADAKDGQPYLGGTFDSWTEVCRKTPTGADPCWLHQMLKDQTGNPTAEITIFALPPGQQAAAGAEVLAPLETLLTKDVRIAIDGAQAKLYPFAFCGRQGCLARIGFTTAEVAALQKGTSATVTIVPAAAPTRQVDLPVSLKGFTAGYAEIEKALPKK